MWVVGWRRWGILLVAGAGALVAPTGARQAHAQGIPRTVAHDARDAAHDALRIWAAPFHTGADDLPGLGAAAAGALLVYSVDRPIQDWVRGHQGSLVVRATTPFREGHPLLALGSASTLALGSAGLYAAGLLFDERSLREAGLGCAAAVEAGSLARHVVYEAVGRARPSVADGPSAWSLGPGDWDHRSFFGGHAANLMTCSTFLATRFRLGPGEPVLYALALGVALGRIADQRHWPSDTFVGLIVGYATGRLEAQRVAARRPAGAPAPARTSAWRFPAGVTPVQGLRLLPGRDGGIIVLVGRRL